MVRHIGSLAVVLACMISGPLAAARGHDENPKPLIQIAILLDTSNSMDGLIDQARSQLWKIVNEFALCRRHGQRPQLEVALYEYGKPTLGAEGGYIRQIVPLTTDLDKISEELFALRTNGGEEYCGWVIQRATRELAWSASPADLKAIFIAGNEPFTQGPIDYRLSCRAAIARGIIVNTIHCGPSAEGERTGWRDGALLADGSFTNIDQNRALTAIPAPQDKEIATLGEKLNTTYVVFGAGGKAGQARQSAQDTNAANAVAKDSLVQRSLFKGSANYTCAQWDLVDACKQGKVKLAELAPDQLPDEMKTMTPAQRKAYLESKETARADIQKQIARLNKEREQFVTAERKRQAAKTGAQSLDMAVIDGLRKQAAKKEFIFDQP